MSGLSITRTRAPEALSTFPRSNDRGTIWIGSPAAQAALGIVERPRHGCNIVRRITDDRGREWRVRQLWSENCHGLLYECAVRGVRSEIRPVRGHLETMTDAELLVALAPGDD